MASHKSIIRRYFAKLLQKWKVLTIALKNCDYWPHHPCFDCINYHNFKGRRPWLRSSNNRISCHYRHMLVNMESSNNGMSYSSNFFPSNFAAVILPAATSTFGNKPWTKSLILPIRQTKDNLNALRKWVNHDSPMSSKCPIRLPENNGVWILGMIISV
mgnify:CR=1 FL=1